MPPKPEQPSPLHPLPLHPLIVALVVAICIVFLMCSCRILTKHCCAICRQIFRRNSHVQGPLLNEGSFDDDPQQVYSRGLDLSVMHSIPMIQFNKNGEEAASQINTDCAVCLGEFEEGEWLRRLPNCCHAFHVLCIDNWFQRHSNCPLCRSQVYDFSIPQDYAVSVFTLLETLRREDFFQERAAQYQILRRNSAIGRGSTNTS